jgi:hypothetical protein
VTVENSEQVEEIIEILEDIDHELNVLDIEVLDD